MLGMFSPLFLNSFVVVVMKGSGILIPRVLSPYKPVTKIGRIVVDKSMRGKGIGRELMEYVETWAVGEGVEVCFPLYICTTSCTPASTLNRASPNPKKITISSRLAKAGFYEKCGYTRVGGVFMQSDMEHVEVEKSLR